MAGSAAFIVSDVMEFVLIDNGYVRYFSLPDNTGLIGTGNGSATADAPKPMILRSEEFLLRKRVFAVSPSIVKLRFDNGYVVVFLLDVKTYLVLSSLAMLEKSKIPFCF